MEKLSGAPSAGNDWYSDPVEFPKIRTYIDARVARLGIVNVADREEAVQEILVRLFETHKEGPITVNQVSSAIAGYFRVRPINYRFSEESLSSQPAVRSDDIDNPPEYTTPEPVEPVGHRYDPAHVAVVNEDLGLMDEGISQLPANQRQVLLNEGGLTNHELAERMSISRSTVSRLRKGAKDALRQKLELAGV